MPDASDEEGGNPSATNREVTFGLRKAIVVALAGTLIAALVAFANL